MAEQSSKTPVLVAVIGVIGTLGAALVANWDKLFAHPPAAAPAVSAVTAVAAPPAAVAPAAAPAPALTPTPANPAPLTGMWRDSANPSIVSELVQEGSSLRFHRVGALPNGVAFESSGTGIVDGRQVSTQYAAHYQNGRSSSGQCTGSMSAAADTVVLDCSDTLLGSFQSTSIRR